MNATQSLSTSVQFIRHLQCYTDAYSGFMFNMNYGIMQDQVCFLSVTPYKVAGGDWSICSQFNNCFCLAYKMSQIGHLQSCFVHN